MISWAKPGTIAKEHPIYPVLVLGNILITTFLAVLSAVATIVADDSIQGDLALSDPLATWLTTLYLLGVNTTVPSASWFADRFGYKTMYALGVTIFTLASALAGFSTNFAMIGSARLLEGIGAGFIFPIGLATIVQNLSPKQLPLALILYVMAAFGAGFAIGLPVAGYLTQFISWRWIFFLIIPIGLIGTLSCWIVHEETEKIKTSRFDYGGFICFALFVGSFLVALTYGPMLATDEGWRSTPILICFAVAFICLLLTIYIETHHENPMIPIVLFKNPVYAVTCVAMFLLGMSIFASVSTLIQYMVDALLYERFVAGKIGIIYGVSLAVFSILANLFIRKIPVPIMTFIGLSLLVYSYFLNNILDWQTGPKQILTILSIRGIALGLSLGPATIQALQHVPKELANKGATLLTFFRQVGGTYGGTLIAIIVIKRKIFHAARFGEQANTQLPGYQTTFQKLYTHYNTTLFDHGDDSAALAKATIIRNIEIQAFIQAINDAMIVFAYVTMAVALILILLSLKNWKKSRSQETANAPE